MDVAWAFDTTVFEGTGLSLPVSSGVLAPRASATLALHYAPTKIGPIDISLPLHLDGSAQLVGNGAKTILLYYYITSLYHYTILFYSWIVDHDRTHRLSLSIQLDGLGMVENGAVFHSNTGTPP